MNKKIISSRDEQDLRNLYRYLNYELSTSILFLLSFLPGFMMILLTIAALIFTPYMLYVLYRTKKNGWLISFIVLIFGPYIIVKLTMGPSEYSWLFSMAGFVFFFLYCFLLRLSIGGQLSEISARHQFEMQRELKSSEFNIWEQDLNTKRK